MEFIEKAVNFASLAVTGFGAGVLISGIINFGEGKSQQNAAKQDEGMSKIVGGIIIAVVGLLLVPELIPLLTKMS